MLMFIILLKNLYIIKNKSNLSAVRIAWRHQGCTKGSQTNGQYLYELLKVLKSVEKSGNLARNVYMRRFLRINMNPVKNLLNTRGTFKRRRVDSPTGFLPRGEQHLATWRVNSRSSGSAERGRGIEEDLLGSLSHLPPLPLQPKIEINFYHSLMKIENWFVSILQLYIDIQHAYTTQSKRRL